MGRDGRVPSRIRASAPPPRFVPLSTAATGTLLHPRAIQLLGQGHVPRPLYTTGWGEAGTPGGKWASVATAGRRMEITKQDMAGKSPGGEGM